VSNNSTDAITILGDLIAYDTTSRNSNLDLIDYVGEYLKSHNLKSDLVVSEDGQKANLFATIGPNPGSENGTDEMEASGIALSGHTDVVPTDGQDWHSDPFFMTEKDGRLYGRGTSDMKGFIACALAAVPEFNSRTLKKPIHLVFSYDEEIGCLGIRPLIKKFGDELPKPEMVIVGEPTSMAVVDAHKGATRFETIVTGHEAHSSMSHIGVNAIDYAALIIRELRTIEDDFARAHNSDRFTPPFSTVHVGTIEGGTALNIVPKTCRFVWEVRALPGLNSAEVLTRVQNFANEKCLPEMRRIAPECEILIREENNIPSFNASQSSAVNLAMQLAEQNDTLAVSYGTEAGLFELGGAPTVICGPGDIAQAHKPDEFIEISQINACMKFMSGLANWAET